MLCVDSRNARDSIREGFRVIYVACYDTCLIGCLYSVWCRNEVRLLKLCLKECVFPNTCCMNFHLVRLEGNAVSYSSVFRVQNHSQSGVLIATCLG
jgi:hypothetical protein